MKTRLLVSLLLAAGLVLALMLAFTYAQGGDSAPNEATGNPVDDHDLNDPPAAGTKVLYMFTGVTDIYTNNVATVVHCSNFGTMDSQIYIEFFDTNAGSEKVFTATEVIPENETRTFSTGPTALYRREIEARIDDDLDQGSGRVIVPVSNTHFICTAQVIHSTAVPPKFGIKLTLYDAHGNIVGHNTPTIYLPIVLRNT